MSESQPTTRILYRKIHFAIFLTGMTGVLCSHSFAPTMKQKHLNTLSFFLNLMFSFLWDKELEISSLGQKEHLFYISPNVTNCFLQGFNNFYFITKRWENLSLLSPPAVISVSKVFLPTLCRSIRKS